MNPKFSLSALTLLLAAFTPGISLADAGAVLKQNEVLDTVYTLSNNAIQNEVLVFHRMANGSMVPAGHFPTGGKGTGNGLGNQGALALSKDDRYLFAINAGSNDVSVFRITQGQLELIDRAADEGKTPVSVTADHNRIYVVNAGDDSIFGYKFDPQEGKLNPLDFSHQPLSGTATGPAQISFDREGEALVVTEKASNKITTFRVGEDNIPATKFVLDSAGATPFGFAFGHRGQFFVSEAEGAVPGAATVSAYELKEDGSAQLLDGAVAAEQTAACWLATTPNGRIAFTANTPANSISAFSINPDGQLTLLQAIAAVENLPTDLGISRDGTVLYTLSGGDHSIGIYRIGADGDLEKQVSIANLPAGVTGLVVR